MDSAPGSPRKRRLKFNPSIDNENDSTVAALQSQGVQRRYPLRETRNKGNYMHHATPDLDNPSLEHTESTTGRQKKITQSIGPSIPTPCCYRCRVRGGRAAYNCTYELGEQSCTLCLRENGGKCRMPSDDEYKQIEARCPQCKQRGFKTCIGRPCNPCINEGKANKCGQPVEKKAKHSHVSSMETVYATSTQSGLAGADGSSRKERLVQDEMPLVVALNGNRHQVSGGSKAGNESEVMHIENVTDLVFEDHPAKNFNSHLNGTSIAAKARIQVGATTTVESVSEEMITRTGRKLTNSIGHQATEVSILQPPNQVKPFQGRLRRAQRVIPYFDPPIDETTMLDSDISNGAQSSVPPSLKEIQHDELSKSRTCQSRNLRQSVDEDAVSAKVYEPANETQNSSKKPQIKGGKGIDLDLPPINTIEDAFADMAQNAAELGLCNILQKLDGVLNVATMCSGTESPLLALNLLSDALAKAGMPIIKFHHCFSVEIDVVKQAFIERNYQPPIIFRDARDFIPPNAETATTAYGSEVEIPSRIDLFIAGFVCKDLSSLNNKKKTLEDEGESGDTWRAIYEYARNHRPKIVLLENVKNKAALWDTLIQKWSDIGYEAGWIYCDTKDYYLPQTRERMYMIAIERNSYGEGVQEAVIEWKDCMQSLRRRCSQPYEAFLKNFPQECNDYNALISEPEWALCKLRYDHIRSAYELGISRPVTKWSEDGTIRPPDFANKSWYYSQSSRVYDAIDVAHLQGAQKGDDSLYKMAIWDVSQNVDRFKADLGILPCITPGGCDFASNRQQALNGSELLLLQGLPLNKILFARETQKERQDLAGNAMSTPVIGASIVSAIIAGLTQILSNWSPALNASPEGNNPLQERAKENVIAFPVLQKLDIKSQHLDAFDLVGLKEEAFLSSRMCACEGDNSIQRVSIQVCSVCAHTACTKCSGNPKHRFLNVIRHCERKQTPLQFLQKWKSLFPAWLALKDFPDVLNMIPASEYSGEEAAFLNHLTSLQLEKQRFSLQGLRRHNHAWRLTYLSSKARIDVQIGQSIEWLLFVHPPPELPVNSEMRNLCELPVARALAIETWLPSEWKLHLPGLNTGKVHIRDSTTRAPSWRNRLGLSDYVAETIPEHLYIQGQGTPFNTISGRFDLLPECGTASSSLYKSVKQELYLFFDPDPIGKSENDQFVFSQDCSRKTYGETRMSMARVDSSWRPWSTRRKATCDVKVTVLGMWLPVTLNLKVTEVPMSISVPEDMGTCLRSQHDCSRPFGLLKIDVSERLFRPASLDCTSIMKRAKRLSFFSTWQKLGHELSTGCHCAPIYPRMVWYVDDQGVASPYEDRKAAALFERTIKTRSDTFDIQRISSTNNTQIQIGLNIASLVHRAVGHLTRANQVNASWRLVMEHCDLPFEPFPKFQLLSNVADVALPLPQNLSYLRHNQPKALAWMKSQELGRSITVTEVEEAIDRNLGWRAEARAQSTLKICGGVLADHPSFGKTVTTIALIQSEFEENIHPSQLSQNQRIQSPSLLASSATLIVCPPHIVFQWKAELLKFLGEDKYGLYNILIIENFSQLQRLTIDDICNSRVIVVSWTLFAENDHLAHLARFSAMPEPKITSRRAFDAWLSRALEEVPGQIFQMQHMQFNNFQEFTKEALNNRLQEEEFRVTLPLRARHGSAYQSFMAMQLQQAQSKPKYNPLRMSSGPNPKIKSRQVPLLHLFRYNRIVVDEYHYLNDDKKIDNALSSVSVKRIVAEKRWVLSGTPSLNSFTDVDQIASYLGVNLGRYSYGDGKITNTFEKSRRGDRTLLEDFIGHTEVMSRQWHQARHERAQEFLNLFVRQNEACLGHITCSENLVPVDLDIAHHALYLELSQHLLSQKMQIKKINSKNSSDKNDRLNISLNNSTTAEEALLKCALILETTEVRFGLTALLSKREEQLRGTQTDLLRLMSGFQGLNKTDEISDLYNHFTKDIKKHNWLGDEEASRDARRLLLQAEKKPDSSAFPDLRKTDLANDMRNKIAKQFLSQLRGTARELALRTRSARFIAAIQSFLEPLAGCSMERTFTCSSPSCEGTASLSHMYLLAHCGHTVCSDCLEARIGDDVCIHSSCFLRVQSANLIKITDLGPATAQVVGQGFGKKVEAIIQLVSNFPKSDQGLIFAPNDEIICVLEEVFEQHGILFHSLRRSKAAQAARIIEDFKTDGGPKKNRKVLILNLGSEFAAGVNLTNANHVVFVAPLLAKNQTEYDSAMAQAIARSRRFGQQKRVHIYHVVALRTIDVDILEHRHKRLDGIASLGSAMKMPAPQSKKEGVRLIKNKAGEAALVPVSWLKDASKRRFMSVDDKNQSWRSLISFSETFQRGDN